MGLCKGGSRNVEGGHILCRAVGSNFVGVIATAEGLFHLHFSVVWIGSLAPLCLSLLDVLELAVASYLTIDKSTCYHFVNSEL